MAALASCASFDEFTAAPALGLVAVNDQSSPPRGPYSSAIQAGDFVFTSGVIAFNSETGAFAEAEISAQTEQAFDNLKSVLAVAGVDFGDLVKVTIFLKNPADMEGMNIVYEQRLGANRPARTTVPGADWGRDDILIEIDAVAMRRN